MKITYLSLIALMTALMGCSSVPESIKDDGREAADRAKANAERAYEEMERDIK